jgi:bifunctional DNA-binding transcriptional regulator/antitoxin component of YhaV-PrlF toxin-antitoxin module
MKTTLNADGQVSIPSEICQADHLAPGDLFEVERLTLGHYLLAKQQPAGARFTVATGDDGLPVIRATIGVITARVVKEIESQTP